MPLITNGDEDDEVTEYLNVVLDAYKNGTCTRDDARGSLWQVIDAAVKQNPGFMGNVRAYKKLFMRDA